MITVVTDSTVYITREQAAQWSIRVIPMRYTVGGQQYLESYSDCNGNFESLMNLRHSTTAQVSVSSFVSAFEELIRKGESVLCLVISSRLSGAYRTASLAARQVNRDNPGKVMVVDSQTTAGGLYLLCKQAVSILNENQNIPLAELAERVESLRSRIGVVFSLESMDSLRQSGRIGIVRQSVSTILNIRPILKCVDGAVVSQGKARGRVEQVRELMRCVPKTAQELVLNALRFDATTDQLERELSKCFPHAPILKMHVGPVLGIHLGKGAMGVAWFEKE